MGVEAVHRALARQSLGQYGNDRAFMKFDQRRDRDRRGQQRRARLHEHPRRGQAAPGRGLRLRRRRARPRAATTTSTRCRSARPTTRRQHPHAERRLAPAGRGRRGSAPPHGRGDRPPARRYHGGASARAKCCGCTGAFQAPRAGSIPVARLRNKPRGVAQSGSAPGWGPGGRRFKSCLPDQARGPHLRASFVLGVGGVRADGELSAHSHRQRGSARRRNRSRPMTSSPRGVAGSRHREGGG